MYEAEFKVRLDCEMRNAECTLVLYECLATTSTKLLDGAILGSVCRPAVGLSHPCGQVKNAWSCTSTPLRPVRGTLLTEAQVMCLRQ
jgi:hypothetical protein